MNEKAKLVGGLQYYWVNGKKKKKRFSESIQGREKEINEKTWRSSDKKRKINQYQPNETNVNVFM